KNANLTKRAAIDAAARNNVAGRPLVIDTSNITLGGLRTHQDGTWEFIPDQTPLMAAKIDVNMTSGSPSGSIPLFFAPLLGTNDYAPRNTSVAGFVQNAIVLCLDRSHSMCFDMTGVDWSYPPNTPSWPQAYTAPPMNGSRWLSLVSSVQMFLDVLDDYSQNPPVGMVTWGSDIAPQNWYGTRIPRFNAVEVDVTIMNNGGGNINGALNGRGQKMMQGATNMSAGMVAARDLLMNYTPNLPVNRVMILVTDGKWNQGTDPVATAATLAANNIKCHTIGLLTGDSAAVLQSIADATGGKCFMVNDQAGMDAAFREIATELPIVLTQ
ncbi:MAG: VWA domain-containing protein, partial [Planctomycetaceae bacterium]|nr:VWA domain-containing protein [Planctomycetaceae bacterium]